MDPISSKIFLGAAGSGGALVDTNYWMNFFGSTSTTFVQILDVVTDSFNNVYASGTTDTGPNGGSDVILVKYDKLGSVVWQRAIGTAANDASLITYSRIALDASLNIYFSNNRLLVKYDNNGNLVWQRNLPTLIRSNATDSGGNTYVVGGQSNNALIVKFDSSGTVQWARTLDSGGATADEYLDVHIGSDGFIYCIGLFNGISATVKYDSSGTVQWQRSYSTSSTTGRYLTDDGQGGLIICGSTAVVSGTDIFILKCNTSNGAAQFTRLLDNISNEVGTGVGTDSQGNIYLTANTWRENSNRTTVLLAKYNSSGTIQFVNYFQQTATTPSNDNRGYNIHVDRSGNVYVVGYSNANSISGARGFIGKVPADGSLRGIYSSVVYGQGTSFTQPSFSFAPSTTAYTSASVTYTDAAQTFTSLTSTIPSTRVVIA